MSSNLFSEERLKDPVYDGILGCIYGQALGDAVGLSCEFLFKKEIEHHYGKDPIPFPKFVRNRHNQRWAEGDWTDDTDQMILLMDSLVDTLGTVQPTDFGICLKMSSSMTDRITAVKLRSWVQNGFPELGDHAGMGLGMTVGTVVSQPTFTTDPHGAALKKWIDMGRDLAPNGSVMRTSIVACHRFEDIDQVAKNSSDMCRVTHADPRCIHNTVAMCHIIATILKKRKDHHEAVPFALEDKELNETIEEGIRKGHEAVEKKGMLQFVLGGWLTRTSPFDDEMLEIIDSFMVKDNDVQTLYNLQLDDQKSIGYTLKCFGSGLWALRSTRSFKDTIDLLVREGGDADTNGAVAGALLGAKLGYKQLPREWLESLRHKEWLEEKVEKFLKLQGLI
ncbi:hypothetical protein PROFUN_11634 [Planoprotostelium fungivorum]|uniref:ADP-ribosylglycohydrolase n=1 Tax=Planoprotostelium fungivorum TaxID=1890364 RepID=A0A2P6N9Q4_9EUKA|nr:hypothetical protein PROFUN_11634 [Planoprotostelium fungivorum]